MLTPPKSRLKYVSYNTVERALFEIFFYKVKTVESQQRLLLLAHLRFAAGTIYLGCPLELREVWANKSLLSRPAAACK